jgi:ABC-2 type transport system ATP-binding protein
VLDRFGAPVTARPGAAAVRLHGGVDVLPAVVRALDGENLTVADFRLHAPTLDDVFLAKTGRKLEGAEPAAEPEVVPA